MAKKRLSSHAARGGKARASVLSSDERIAIARTAAIARWGDKRQDGQASNSLVQPQKQATNIRTGASAPGLPLALFPGHLEIGDQRLPVYVLDNGKRVINQSEVVRILTDGSTTGFLARYLNAQNISDYIDAEHILSQSIRFSIPATRFEGIGYEATLLIEICDAYLKARSAGKLIKSQETMAKQAEIIMRACAKVGIIALIDEATGYEAFKKKRDLQLKLQAFIAEDLQEWALMFPQEFWFELARLEGIHYSPRSRPLRWGKYIMAFVYDAIDGNGEVGKELRKINPDPHFRKNHHQWLKEFGRSKVHDQVQKVITIMKLCDDMNDFRKKFARVFKNSAIDPQLTFAWE